MRIKQGDDFVKKTRDFIGSVPNPSQVRYVACLRLGSDPSMKLKITDDRLCYTWESDQSQDSSKMLSLNRTLMNKLSNRSLKKAPISTQPDKKPKEKSPTSTNISKNVKKNNSSSKTSVPNKSFNRKKKTIKKS